MSLRRLILPAVLRGPVRARFDDDLPLKVAPPRRSPVALLLIAWLGLCVGLYLLVQMGVRPKELESAQPAGATAESMSKPLTATRSAPLIQAPPLTAPSSNTVNRPLVPVRDRSDLGTFGAGLSRHSSQQNATEDDVEWESETEQPSE